MRWRRDLSVLDELARLVEDRTSWGRKYRVSELAGEFAERLTDELDFRIEERTAKEIARALPRESRVRIPRVYSSLTTARVLVLERFDGAAVSAAEWHSDIERKELADELLRRGHAPDARRRALPRRPAPGQRPAARTAATSGSSTSAAPAGSTRCSRPGCATCSSRSAPAAPRRCGRRCSRWRSRAGTPTRTPSSGPWPVSSPSTCPAARRPTRPCSTTCSSCASPSS